jgi:hypothetical protein
MNRKILLSAIALSLLSYSTLSQAGDSQTDAQKNQECATDTILLVAEKMNLKEVSKSDESWRPFKMEGVGSAACKVAPQNKNLTYVALATGSEDKLNDNNGILDLTLVIINNKTKKIESSYRDKLEQDASLRVQPGTLRIDTANYKLNETTRAFGVDMVSGYIPNCGDGGLGAVRTLYIQEGKKIRPILKDLIMSTWMYVAQGLSNCNVIAKEDDPTIIENHDISLNMADTTTNGFRDIIVNMKASLDIDDNDKDDTEITKKVNKDIKKYLPKGIKLKPYSYTVTYDGKHYSKDKIESVFWQWRGRELEQK